MSAYSCTPEIPQVPGLDEKITVGRHVLLNCAPDSNEATAVLNIENAKFKLAEAAKDSLRLFKISAAADGKLNLDLTYYTAGVHPLNQLIITDGQLEISLNGPAITVASVLQPSQDSKPQEPFGSLFPLPISIPAIYLWGLAGLLVLAVIYSVIKAKRLAYYKRLKAGLARYNSPIEPDTQFYKAIRLAEKADYPVDQIEKAFRLYNVRAYKLPLFDLPNEKIARYFRRNFPQHKTTRLGLQKLLNEFEELSRKQAELTSEQKNDFVKKLYRYVEKNRGVDT